MLQEMKNATLKKKKLPEAENFKVQPLNVLVDVSNIKPTGYSSPRRLQNLLNSSWCPRKIEIKERQSLVSK